MAVRINTLVGDLEDYDMIYVMMNFEGRYDFSRHRGYDRLINFEYEISTNDRTAYYWEMSESNNLHDPNMAGANVRRRISKQEFADAMKKAIRVEIHKPYEDKRILKGAA